jgi:tetratricopeptide (TPR) repeat protein
MLQPQAIFFHEYAHHLQLQNASAVVPTWLAEGFAEFFASAEIRKDGTVTIGKFPQYRWWGVHDRGSIPIEQMVGVTYDKRLTGEQMEALYARGWLLTDYLAMSDSRKGQLTHYLEGIHSGMTPLESAKAAFGDLKVLQHDMDAYSRQLTSIDISAKVIPIGDVAILPLCAGEAAIMDVRIRSKRGVDQRSAPDVATAARRIAADYPNDPAVQGALAEAEYDARNYAAADAAADRALAADPNDVHALIYKGRALMAKATANPKLTDWDAIRGWFLKANKLDTENAEPLALYYESFVAAGQRPTQNAADALLYAVDLAPRDNGVRMTAVAWLLAQNKLPDAKAMLGPIAYQPHLNPEMQELANNIMAAITAGDAKTAIGLLDQKDKTGKPAKP